MSLNAAVIGLGSFGSRHIRTIQKLGLGKVSAIVTRKKIEELCNVTRYKATLYIKKLIKNGVIKNIGYKTHPIYTINKHDDA